MSRHFILFCVAICLCGSPSVSVQKPFSCAFAVGAFNGDGIGRGSLQLLTDRLYTYAGACELDVTKKAASGRGKGTILPPLARH